MATLTQKKIEPSSKILAGLEQALSVERGECSPARERCFDRRGFARLDTKTSPLALRVVK